MAGKGEYFFLDTQLIRIELENNNYSLALAGRIVKNAKIKREQIYKEGEIVLDKKELETAPTSIFVLLLHNHRLIFCREVAGAPTIQNLESTSRTFLQRRHSEFINELMVQKESELKQKPPRGTKSKLLREYPMPDLRITPLSNTQSLSDFVDRFAKIEALTIKLLPTNQEEIDNDDFWKDLGRRKDEMRSNSATVKFSNGKDGLNPTEVVAQTSSATGMGNSTVQLVGHDSQGDLLKGDNEDFVLKIEVVELPKDVPLAAKTMQGTFNQACKNGFIKLPELATTVLNRVHSLIRPQV